jgi:hypothetical protein
MDSQRSKSDKSGYGRAPRRKIHLAVAISRLAEGRKPERVGYFYQHGFARFSLSFRKKLEGNL